MLKGLRMQLFFDGRPVDRTTIETLESVQVQASSDGPAGFQMTFQLISRSRVHDQFLFSGQGIRKESRINVVVQLNSSNHYLIDGVITNHQLTPNARPGVTNLTLTGEDLTRVMDYVERDGRPFKNQSLATRVKKILENYSSYGISARVINEKYPDAGTETRAVPHQRGTDLQYIRTLANTAGHVFYIEPVGVNRSQAYWGPEFQAHAPLSALSVDMGVATNIESLNLAFNSEQRENPGVTSQQPDNRNAKPISVPDKYELNKQTEGGTALPDKRQTKLHETAKFSDARAKMEGLAVATRSNNAVTAQGSLDTLRYGGLLKPRHKIEVRGATQAFNGTWIIRSVTHRIARGEYKQDFQLVRNSLSTNKNRVKTIRL